jgi:hypothetical protein
MLTEWDDFLIHQIVSTMDHVDSSDPRWHDRYWFHLGDIQGEVLLGIGMGVYPNRNVMDGFSLGVVDGAQHNILVSRELGSDRDTTVGPLCIHVEKGLRRIRLTLEPNDFEISYDLVWDSTMPPFEEQPHFQRHKGRISRNNARYNQSGRFSGTLTVAGRTWQIDPERFWGVRDRSWGLRPGQGEPIPEMTAEQRQQLLAAIGFGLYHYNPVQFPDYSLFYMHNENPEGHVNVIDGGLRFPYGSDREDEVLRVAGIEHEMEFEPGTARFQSGRVELTLGDASVKRYTVRPILPCFLGEGGYADPKRWHGSHRGKLAVEGHSLDLTDAKVLNRLGYASDYFSEWRCDDGEVGYGQYEYIIGASKRLASSTG